MNESILTSIKKLLNIPADYAVFDQDILIHINSAFGTLHQLGLGPVEGFEISDDSVTWNAFMGGDPKLNSVRTYVFLKVKLPFDPPPTSFGLDALKQQISELEWRLNVVREEVIYGPDVPQPDYDVVYDGGTP